MDELATIGEVLEIFGTRLRDHEDPDAQTIGLWLLKFGRQLREIAAGAK